jgi:hypothetical protein
LLAEELTSQQYSDIYTNCYLLLYRHGNGALDNMVSLICPLQIRKVRHGEIGQGGIRGIHSCNLNSETQLLVPRTEREHVGVHTDLDARGS